MAQVMMDKTCRDFAEALAAREPVPGGGSASAYVGALGASLCSMVARYGASNPRFAEVEDDLRHAIAASGRIGFELLELVEEDVRAYGLVSAAYGMERDNPHRSEVIQDALHEAALPPYRIMPVRACLPCLRKWPIRAPVNFFQTLPAALCFAVLRCRAQV